MEKIPKEITLLSGSWLLLGGLFFLLAYSLIFLNLFLITECLIILFIPCIIFGLASVIISYKTKKGRKKTIIIGIDFSVILILLLSVPTVIFFFSFWQQPEQFFSLGILPFILGFLSLIVCIIISIISSTKSITAFLDTKDNTK